MKQIIILIIFVFTAQIQAQDVGFFNYDGFNSIGTHANRTASITLYDIDRDGDLERFKNQYKE